MLLFICKMKKKQCIICFLGYLFYCFFLLFVAAVLIYYNKDKIKNSYIVIIKIVIIIKKRTGGTDATLLGDFALEPSENLTDFADSINFKRV